MREELSWFDRQPLFGKRILVTRPREQAGPTLAALQRRGAEPIALPTIAIEAPPDPAAVSAAVRALHRYDWIIFTSQNGVDWFWRALADNGLDSRAFGGARVAVIGPATGRALGHYGIRPDVTAKTFVAESLAEELLAAVQDAQARVLLPRAMVAREVLRETLRARGRVADGRPGVQPVEATEAGDALRSQLAQIDVVTFTSSSTVEQLVELIGDDAPTRLAHATLASIGPITTKTAERLGLRVAVTATVSTGPGLINALEDHFRDG